MYIRKPRNLSFVQIAVTIVVGFIGGVYIVQPVLQRTHKDEKLGRKSLAPDPEQQIPAATQKQ